MLNRNHLYFIFSFCIFALLGSAYYFIYQPVYFVDGIRYYNPNFLQGDAINYLNYAKIEIQGRSFFEWYLKLDKSNIGLVYFAWIDSVLSLVKVPQLFICILFISIGYMYVFKIIMVDKLQPIFSWFSIVSSFSLIVFMQSFTKEIFIFPLFILAIRSIQTRNLKLGIVSIFILMLVRLYFSMIFIISFLVFTLLRNGKKRLAGSLCLFLVLCLPYLFTEILTSFTVLRSSSLGFSRFYVLVLNYNILYIFWIPFKIIQNILEPTIFVLSLKANKLILEPLALLDFLTSISIMLHLGVIFKLKKYFKTADDLTKFLLIFSGLFLFIIASIPIVHFRYLVPILPIFGLIIDQLLNTSKSIST